MKVNHSEIRVCLGKQNKSGRCPVRIRVSFRGNRQDLYLGFSVESDKWDFRKEKVKHGCIVCDTPYNELNKMIDQAVNTVEDFFVY